jgi:hypothetical protein
VGADAGEHAFPFGEDDDFDVGVGEDFVEDAGEFVELGAVGAGLGFDDGGGVTDHAHHVHEDHELVLLFGGEGAALGDVDEFGDLVGVFGVDGALLRSEGDEEVAVGAVGEFGFDVVFEAAEKEGGDAGAELVQVLVAGGPAFVVEGVVVAVEAEEGAEEGGVEVVDDGAEFVDAVFDGGGR